MNQKLSYLMKWIMLSIAACYWVGCKEPNDASQGAPVSVDKGAGGRSEVKGTEIVIRSLKQDSQIVRLTTYGRLVFSPDSTLYVELTGTDTSELERITKSWAASGGSVTVTIGGVDIGPIRINEGISGSAFVLKLSDPNATANGFRERSIKYDGTVGKKPAPIAETIDDVVRDLLPPSPGSNNN